MRLLQQQPLLFAVPAQRLPGNLGHILLVWLERFAQLGCLKRGDDPLTHFSRGFAGKGDGEDLLRLVYHAQECQQAPHQQPGFSRSGGCLHDERLRRVNRLVAFPLVNQGHVDPPDWHACECGKVL